MGQEEQRTRVAHLCFILELPSMSLRWLWSWLLTLASSARSKCGVDGVAHRRAVGARAAATPLAPLDDWLAIG